MHDVQLNGRKHTARTDIETILGEAVEASRDEHILSVGDPLRVLWRRLWVIVLVAVVFTGLAVGYSLMQVPTYRASIKLLVGQDSSNVPAGLVYPGALSGEVQGLKDITGTMLQAISTRPVAEATIQQVNLGMSPDYLGMSPEDLLQNLSVERIEETQFIEVSYEGSNPQETQQIVNTLGEVFSEQPLQVSPNASAITARVYEEAVVPGSPVGPDPVRNGALALVLGGMLGIGLAFLLERLDDRWKSPEEVEQISGAPIFGIVPKFKVPKVPSSDKKKGER